MSATTTFSPPSRHTWYHVTASADGEAEIAIMEAIGSFGVSAKQFVGDLKKITAPVINLHINSPGGVLTEGLAIYNGLKDHPAKIVAHVDGMAASIASVIVMAADEINMSASALMMLHNPSGMVDGGSKEFDKASQVLSKMANIIAKIYADRSGLPLAKILEMQDAETWLTADEAKALGLADSITPNKSASRTAKAMAEFDLSMFRRVPTNLLKATGQPETLGDDEALAQADREWQANAAACQNRFATKEIYVAFRVRQLRDNSACARTERAMRKQDRERTDASSPEGMASAEWDTKPECRNGFTTKGRYVAFRAAELAGLIQVSRPVSTTFTAPPAAK